MSRKTEITPEIEQEVKRLYMEGNKFYREIADAVGISSVSANNIIRYKFPEVLRKPRTVNLTPEEEQYVKDNPDNLLHRELAEKLGCSKFIIGKIKRESSESDRSIYFSDVNNPAFIFY